MLAASSPLAVMYDLVFVSDVGLKNTQKRMVVTNVTSAITAERRVIEDQSASPSI